MSVMARPEVDLLDPSFHVGDPHPAYRWMRQHEPIYRDEGNRLWAMTRMEHLRHVERHTEAFSSNHGYRSVWIPTETSMISKDDPAHSAQRKLIAVGRCSARCRTARSNASSLGSSRMASATP